MFIVSFSENYLLANTG